MVGGFVLLSSHDCSMSAVLFLIVSKHPWAVLLLSAQWLMPLTFNEFLTLQSKDAVSVAPVTCSSEHARSHLMTIHVKSTEVQNFFTQQLALHKRLIGQTVPQDVLVLNLSLSIALLTLPLFLPYSAIGNLSIACPSASEASHLTQNRRCRLESCWLETAMASPGGAMAHMTPQQGLKDIKKAQCGDALLGLISVE